jgi:chemotaxis protein CheD
MFSAHGKDPQVCRFVDTALEGMPASLRRLKVSPEDLVLKVFGGASGIMNGNRSGLAGMGGRNPRAVHERLASHGIRVTRPVTGGCRGRKPLFPTHAGEVWVTMLHKPNQEARP